jgi:predicted TPR repeat methyltransferase
MMGRVVAAQSPWEVAAVSAQTSSARSRHWDEVYDTKGTDQVSWFQPEPVVSWELIDGLRLDRTRPVIDVGGGTSKSVDRLVERGHTDVTVLDVSAQALRLAQHRLADRARLVHWEPRTCWGGDRGDGSRCGTTGPCSTS